MTANGARLALLTVGTDHHRFDRLIQWVEAWAVRNPAALEWVVQTGSSTPPRSLPSSMYLPQAALRTAMARAVAVVCGAGPATIMEARQAGIVPIVVPRRPELREHVDGHQVRFAPRVAESGQIVLAGTEQDLHGLLDRAVSDPAAFRAAGPAADGGEAVQRFATLVSGLFER